MRGMVAPLLASLGIASGVADGSAYHGKGDRGFGALMLQLQSLLGVVALIGFAFLISEDRHAVSWKRVGIGVAATAGLAVVFLKVPPVTAAFGAANGMVDAIAAASRAGTSFVFG